MLGQITQKPREFDLEQTTPQLLDLFAVLVTLATDGDSTGWERVNRSLPFRVLRRSDTDQVALAWWERDPDWRRSGERSTQTGGTLPEWADELLRRGAQPDELMHHPEVGGWLWPMLPSTPREVLG